MWKYYNTKFEYIDLYDDIGEPWFGHKFFVYDLVSNFKPNLIVELGTFRGTSMFSMLQAIKDNDLNLQFDAIDIWEGDKHSGDYGEEVLLDVKKILRRYYQNLNVNLIREYFDNAVEKYKDSSIDLLHIDGLHTYEAVKNDFEKWKLKVKKDGIVIFHDISVKKDDFGVYKFWSEIKNNYKTIEFHHSNGLGVLFFSNNKYELVKDIDIERYIIRNAKEVSDKYVNLKSSSNIPRVDIISINYNSKKYIDGYLKAVRNIDYPKDKLHTIIIDNKSTDDSADYIENVVKDDQNISFIRHTVNSGFTGGNNVGLRLSNADIVLLLNIDTEIYPDAVKKMVDKMMSDSDIGICEAKQVPYEHPKYYDIDSGYTGWSSGACMMIRRSALKDVGLFDENFFMYCEDVDLSWRMWANNWKCVYVNEAWCTHHTFDPNDTKKDSVFEFHYGLRNGVFMRGIYGTYKEFFIYILKIVWLILFSKHHTSKQKRAAVWSLLRVPWHMRHVLKRRKKAKKLNNINSPWIKFYGFDYSLPMNYNKDV